MNVYIHLKIYVLNMVYDGFILCFHKLADMTLASVSPRIKLSNNFCDGPLGPQINTGNTLETPWKIPLAQSCPRQWLLV